MGLGVCRAILSQRATHLKQDNIDEIESIKLPPPPDYVREVFYLQIYISIFLFILILIYSSLLLLLLLLMLLGSF